MNKLLFFLVILTGFVLNVSAREIYSADGIVFGNDMTYCDSLTAAVHTLDYHLRVTIPPKAKEAKWTLRLTYGNGQSCLISLSRKGMSAHETDFGLPVNVEISENGNTSGSFVISDKVEAASDGWSLTVKKFPGDDSLRCSVGQKKEIFSFCLPSKGLVKLEASTENTILLNRLSLFSTTGSRDTCDKFENTDALKAYLAKSKDTNEREWTYLDRDCDARYAIMGGDYNLATIKNDTGGYDIVYLGGARSRSDDWMPLMIKGRLKPTAFVDHFDLVWFDAFGNVFDNETSADITEGAILKLNFPLQKSSIRFQRKR